MTATVSSAPFGPGSGGDWATISLNYAGGNGIAVRDGVVESTGLQAFFIYNGQDRLILQILVPIVPMLLVITIAPIVIAMALPIPMVMAMQAAR